MTRRGRKHLIKPLVLVLTALALEGCISPSADSVGRYTAPIGGSPVIVNDTPYSAALRCMSGIVAQHPLRVAVGQIADYTGKAEADGSGRKVTAGAALMAMSALSKAGVHMVERFDTSVAEMELKYANNKLIGDDKDKGDFRKIIAGSIPGSDYYIVGGITELNFNIRSENATGNGGGTATNAVTGTAGGSMYVMNVGLDLRLVNTDTLEVADVISYQKQIIGRQISAGVFDFLGTNFFDISAGESALEPIQLAVRSVIERAVLEMVTRIYHAPPGACSIPINTADDPLADGVPPRPYGKTAPVPVPPPPPPGPRPLQPKPYVEAKPLPYPPPPPPPAPAYVPPPAPAYAPPPPAQAYPQPYPKPQPYPAINQETYNDHARQDPYRGYSSSDPVGDLRLRGGL